MMKMWKAGRPIEKKGEELRTQRMTGDVWAMANGQANMLAKKGSKKMKMDKVWFREGW